MKIKTLLVMASVLWWTTLGIHAAPAPIKVDLGTAVTPRRPNSPQTGDVISDTPSAWANYVYQSNTKWPSEPGMPHDPFYFGREQLCIHVAGSFDPFGIVVDYRLGDFEHIAAWARKEKVDFRDIGIAGEGVRIASIKPPNSKDEESARPSRLLRHVQAQAFFMNVREYPGNSVPYFSPKKGRDAELLVFLGRTGVRVSKFEHSLYNPILQTRQHWLYYQAPIAKDELSFWLSALQEQTFVDEGTFWPAPFLPSKIAVRCFKPRDELQLLKALSKYGYFIQGGASFREPTMNLYRISVPETGEARAIERMRALGLDASFAVVPGDATKETLLSRRYSQRELARADGKGFAGIDGALRGVLETRFGKSSVTSLGGGFFRVNTTYHGPKFLASLDKSGWERVKCLASATVRGRTCFVRVQFDVDGTSKGDSSTKQPLISLFKEFPDTDEMEVREAERIVDDIVRAINGE